VANGDGKLLNWPEFPTKAYNDKDGTSGNPPGGDDLEKRVEALEKAIPDLRERLVRVETKIDSIEKHGATKLDLSTTEGTLIKWFVGTAFAMTGLSAAIAFGLARFLG